MHHASPNSQIPYTAPQNEETDEQLTSGMARLDAGLAMGARELLAKMKSADGDCENILMHHFHNRRRA
jgi:hypothetical protein